MTEEELKATALLYREEYLKQEFFEEFKFKEMTSDGKEFLRFVVMTSMIFAMRKEKIKLENEKYPCPVIDKYCEYYLYQCDSNGEVAICFCTHKDNVNRYEGNCTEPLCPIKEENNEMPLT